MTHYGPTPIKPVVDYKPKGVEVPDGWRLAGWVNRDNLDGFLAGHRTVAGVPRQLFPMTYAKECFYAQVPVLVPVG